MERLLAALRTWRDDFDVVDPFIGPDGLHYRGSTLLVFEHEHFEHTHAVIEAYDDLDDLTSNPLSHTLDSNKEESSDK